LVEVPGLAHEVDSLVAVSLGAVELPDATGTLEGDVILCGVPIPFGTA